MKNSFAKHLVKKTEDDYNKISSLFSNKRSYITPDLEELGAYVEAGDRVLDFGCGNGRFFEVLKGKNVNYLGIDASEKLIKIAQQKYTGVSFEKIGSEINLDRIEAGSFDTIFCLAVLHHIPGKAMRERVISEFKRILKPGGKLVLTVWDLREKSDAKKAILLNAVKRFFRLTQFDYGDLFYPFKNQDGETLADRYLHAFTTKELKRLMKDCGLKLVSIGKNARGKRVVNKNIIVVAIKK